MVSLTEPIFSNSITVANMEQNKSLNEPGLFIQLVTFLPLLAACLAGYHLLFIAPLHDDVQQALESKTAVYVIDVEYLTTIKATSVVKAQQEGLLPSDISIPEVIDAFRSDLVNVIQKRVGNAPVYIKKYILTGSDASVDITHQVGQLMGLDMSLNFINALGGGEDQ